MRKVVDSNMLQSDGLRTFLRQSTNNFAVLTDYVAMESYKGDTLQSIYKSMEILATRPRQVIILKGTQAICGLRGRSAGLQRRMIDVDQTRGFKDYCRNLQSAQNGNQGLEQALLAHGRAATTHMERLLVDATQMAEIFDDIAKSYSQDELKRLRSGNPPTNEMLAKTLRHIGAFMASMVLNHPRITRFPLPNELGNTFVFRFSLSAYVWALRWISVGGAAQTKPEKLRNDMVDINFVVYGTFFDGLLTADAKAKQLHRDMIWWLHALGDYNRREQAFDQR